MGTVNMKVQRAGEREWSATTYLGREPLGIMIGSAAEVRQLVSDVTELARVLPCLVIGARNRRERTRSGSFFVSKANLT